jgi:cation transport ATPase
MSTIAESLRLERRAQVRDGGNRLAVGLLIAVPLVALGYASTIPPEPLGIAPWLPWSMFALASVLQVYLGAPYLVGTWRALSQRSVNADTLMALGTLTVYGYSLIKLLRGDPNCAHSFIDAGIIPVLITLSKYLELRVRVSADEVSEPWVDLRTGGAPVVRGGGGDDVVRDASGSTAGIQRLAGQTASWIVVIGLVIALATFVGWGAIGGTWLSGALNAASVLIVACPCALSLATSTALAAATARGARAGLLVRDASTFERMNWVSAIVFDATGTLTDGNTIKPFAYEVIDELRAHGVEPYLVTGANPQSAHATGEALGLPDEHVMAGMLPAAQAATVAEIRKRGGGRVAMLFDGRNGVPPLAGDDVAIALGHGTDLAGPAADVVIATDDLRAVANAFKLGRATLAAVRQNLFWAFACNSVGIHLAALGVFGQHGPLIAALAVSLCALAVIGRSSLLARVRLDEP